MTIDAPLSTVERTERVGSPALVLLLAVFLVGAAVAFSFLPRTDAGKLITGLLVFLAVIGILGVFAYAVGFLQYSGKAVRNDLTKAISDSAAEGLLVTEGETRIVYANSSYMELSSAREAGDVRTVERLFSGSPDVSEAVYRLAQAAREKRRAIEEIRLAPPLSGEGAVGWYRIRVRPVERAGSRAATLWQVADVTRERERHENVFQELQHAIDFLDHAPAGFFSADAAGAITYVNATLANWLDYDLAQIGSGGMALSQVFAGNGAALLGERNGAPGEVKTDRFDVDLRRRNGQSLPVRLIHRVAYASDGTPGNSRTLVLNRSPGEEPAATSRAAEVQLARFFHSTPMGLASSDERGRITRSNAAFARLFPELMKKPEAERSVTAAVPERDRTALVAALAAATQGQVDVAPIDIGFDGEGGRSIRLYLTPEETENGSPAALLYALDTTEQRTLQENFAQSQKMQAIGQLAGGVAHDFNNVLTAIIGYSDLLLANHRPTDPSFGDIMQIRQNANRAAGLVRQLLAFSRRQTLRPQVLQIGDMLSDLQMLMRRLAGEKIELDLRHGRDLWLVKADLNQLEQVLVNLVVNARDAMADGGRITLRTRNVTATECDGFRESLLTPADYVLIEVEDQGTGIPPEILEKIFEPFFTTKEVGKGTGLGLSMVYGIVKQTGGFVFVSSEIGRGSTFRIFLPRHIPEPEEATPLAEVAAPRPAADLTGTATILLVEDEEAVRAFGARALTSRGYTVLEAASGVEALEIVASTDTTIDLIVSDVVMPEMDGPTMFGELRRRGIKARVIFVSGYAEEAFSKNLPAGEDFGFMAKPFSLKQLIETVKTNLPT